MYDLLVLGSGVAGLTTALAAARRELSVLVLTKGDLVSSATSYAQGGVAAALVAPDTPELHLADTLVAGAGLCDADAVRVLVGEGPERVRALAALGARFDTERDDDTTWQLAREGGHSLARVVHSGGDATGAEIERALVAALHDARVDVREGWFAIDLLIEGSRCRGVLAMDPEGATHNVRALDVVVATGGVGQCFAVTTNPPVSTGDGIALAMRAGAACADLEFVQFHPTALDVDMAPRPLISEALRGEGAILRDDDGVAFMQGLHPMADLAPRDVVSRAIAERYGPDGESRVWLDATMIDDFSTRFPTIAASCARHGVDPSVDWIPVAPAAHYLCGGIVTDLDGATTVPGLWACGESACSGVHGANRLASNSLLDGLVFGARVVAAIVAGKRSAEPTGVMHEVMALAPSVIVPPELDVLAADGDPVDPSALRGSIQRVMTRDVGVIRSHDSLALALDTLRDLSQLAVHQPRRVVMSYETRNLVTIAVAITRAALARVESRGAHTRADHPRPSDAQVGRWVVHGGEALDFVRTANLHEEARS